MQYDVAISMKNLCYHEMFTREERRVMQNLSNATTTRIQLNSIPEKKSKNVKFFFHLPPFSILFLPYYTNILRICVATRKIISSTSLIFTLSPSRLSNTLGEEEKMKEKQFFFTFV